MALNQQINLKNLSNSKCFQANIGRNHLEVNIEKSEYDVLVWLANLSMIYSVFAILTSKQFGTYSSTKIM